MKTENEIQKRFRKVEREIIQNRGKRKISLHYAKRLKEQWRTLKWMLEE